MYKRYYDGYARIKPEKDNGEIIFPQPRADTYRQNCSAVTNVCCDNNNVKKCDCNSKKPFSLPLETDDLILIGILIFLLADNETNDPMLLVIIGFILLSEMF